MRRRFKVWRYRRQLIALGHDPERAALMARACAGLDVPPRLLGPPAVNHWSAWGPR